MEEVRKYPDRPWNKHYLSKNPSIVDINIDELNLTNAKPYDRRIFLFKTDISPHPTIRNPSSIHHFESTYRTIDYILSHPDYKWNVLGLSINPNITIEYIMNNPSDKWNWANISSHISIDEVRKYPHMPWNRRSLSYRDDLTINDILVINCQ